MPHYKNSGLCLSLSTTMSMLAHKFTGGSHNSKSFKIAQKIAFEAKGRQCITGKVIQRLFNIDLYTYLATYPYR